MNKVEIIGTGSYAPANIVTNDDLSKVVDTNDEWISTRTGIRERRISTGENTSDIAAKAALKALEASGVLPSEIDLLIVATTSPDSFTPSTACIVQAIIGAMNATCFDIGAACTGFIYAVNTAVQYIKAGTSKTALVIGAEVLSKILNWEDRTTCVLFGDGAGAAVLKSSSKESIVSIYTGADGTNAKELLYCPAPAVVNPYTESKELNKSYVSMNGKEIFKFGGRIIIKSIDGVLKGTEYTLKDIKYIVPHQANLRIISYVAKKLDIEESKFYINLNNYGNTSAASIPLALDEAIKSGSVKKGDKLILIGFGGGLTWGSILIEL